MTVTAWPSTLPTPSFGLEEEFYKPQIKTEKEANYVQTRRTASRGRRILPLAWTLMTEAEYQILEAFFDTYQGTMFTFTHPVTGTTYNCVFSANSIKAKWKSAGFRGDVQCPIEEV
jgi:hypothetical protein